MTTKVKTGLFALAIPITLVFASAGTASAGTIIDLGVKYTVESNFTPDASNTYDVFLTMDATGFTGSPGYLVAVDLEFHEDNSQGPAISSGESLLQVPSPSVVSDWHADPGGTNSGGCSSSGQFVCFQFTNAVPADALAVPAASQPWVFEFAVTVPTGHTLSSVTHIKAVYDTSASGSGPDGQTSEDTTIGRIGTNNETVPEPASILLSISGIALLGLSRLCRLARR
jgi:hypothetical protein